MRTDHRVRSHVAQTGPIAMLPADWPGLKRAAFAATLLLACTSLTAQVVNITTNTTIGPADTTIGGVPFATAQVIVQGKTLTIDRTDTLTFASMTLQIAGGTPAVLTHTPGTRIDIHTTGSFSIDANSSINADAKGFAGSTGEGAGQTANGYNGGGAGYGGAGGDGAGSSQAETVNTGLGGDCYAFDQASLFDPVVLGSGGGNAWSGGNQVLSSGGLGGGAVRLTVDGTLSLIGQISASGGNGVYLACCGNVGDGGGGSGGSISIRANSIAGTGSVRAAGGSATYGGGGGGGRVAIITNSTTLDEILPPNLSGGLGNGSRGGAGTFYRKLGTETRGTLFIDNNNAANAENTEFYGPLTLNANVIVQHQGRLGPKHRLTDSDLKIFDLTVLGNLTVAADASINADGRGRRGSSGSGQGLTLEGFDGGGGGYGGGGGNGRSFSSSAGTAYGNPYSMLLGSGGGNAWSGGTQVRSSGGFGGGALKLEVRGLLSLAGQINARGGNGAYLACCGNIGAGGGGSGGSIFVATNSISGTGSIAANGGASTYGGGGGGGRVVVVRCNAATPAINVAGGAGNQAGSTGTSIVRTTGFLQQPRSYSACVNGSATYSVTPIGAGPISFQWFKGAEPIDVESNPTAATATLILTNVQPDDAVEYSCVMTAPSCGSITSTTAQLYLNPADAGRAGGFPGGDGLHNNDDFIAFINYFFDQNPRADLGSAGGSWGSDGLFDNNDFIVFINAFFDGC